MEIDKMVGYCGLVCAGCPIYWATGEKNPEDRTKMRRCIARLCDEHYGLALRSEDVTDCNGCRAETGRLFSMCVNCEIRACARQRNVQSCAYCTDYSCEKLQKFFITDPGAKTRLEMIRSIVSDMS